MRHELKTDPMPFQAVWEGTKLYEIRKDDRDRNPAGDKPSDLTGFCIDDELLLRETQHSGEQMKGGRWLTYTGRQVLCVVTHKLTGYGLQDGWCILGIRRLELISTKGPHNGAHWRAQQPPEPLSNTVFTSDKGTEGSLGKVVGEGVKTRDPLFTPILIEPGQVWVDSVGKEIVINSVVEDGNVHTSAGTYIRGLIEKCWKLKEPVFDAINHPDTRKKSVPVEVERRIDAKQMSNKSGGHVSYYSVDVDNPSKGGTAYRAEAIDVIAALDMTFAEGEAFKAVWRCAADRIGAHKDGNDTRRDAEKVEFYGTQMIAREKKRHDGSGS